MRDKIKKILKTIKLTIIKIMIKKVVGLTTYFVVRHFTNDASLSAVLAM